jgi:hypothetical protein
MARNPYIGSGTVQQGGFSATHKQDFNAHIEGGGYFYLAEQIKLSPNVQSQDNVQDALEALSTLVGSISHSSLTNLSSDDHLQYLNRSGVRAMTGNFNIATFAILAANGVGTQQVLLTDSFANVVLNSANGLTLDSTAGTNIMSAGNINTSTDAAANSGNIQIFTGDATGVSSGELRLATGNSTGSGSGQLEIFTGDVVSGSVGAITIRTGSTDASNASGDVIIGAGDAGGNAGSAITIVGSSTGVSGNIVLGIGSAATKGSIVLDTAATITANSFILGSNGTTLDTTKTNVKFARVALDNSEYGLVICKQATGSGDTYLNYECVNFVN